MGAPKRVSLRRSVSGASSSRSHSKSTSPIASVSSPQDGSQEPTEPFDWPAYLAKEKAVAAPPDAFCHGDPPVNSFRIDDLLLAAHPDLIQDSSTRFSLALVTALNGPFLCLWFIGTNKREVFWRLADDASLEPFESLKRQAFMIEPPRNIDWKRYQRMVECAAQRNKTADRNAFAPLDFFLPSNKFQVGMKLEAMDVCRFSGKLHPATVVRVTEYEIEITYDGCANEYNRSMLFDDRSVFRCGTAQRLGVTCALATKHDLQRRPSRSSLIPSSCSPSTKSSPPTGGSQSSSTSTTEKTARKSTQGDLSPKEPIRPLAMGLSVIKHIPYGKPGSDLIKPPMESKSTADTDEDVCEIVYCSPQEPTDRADKVRQLVTRIRMESMEKEKNRKAASLKRKYEMSQESTLMQLVSAAKRPYLCKPNILATSNREPARSTPVASRFMA